MRAAIKNCGSVSYTHLSIGMGKRTNTILQSAFFSLAKVLPEEDAIQYMKEKATQSYSKKGMDVVEMNHKAIDAGATAYVKIDVPAAWANAEDVVAQHNLEGKPELVKQVKNILFPVDKMDGDSLPVSTFVDHVDGQFELGAAAYEKRGVAVAVPEWDSAKCIQCGNCAYVCPHEMCIRDSRCTGRWGRRTSRRGRDSWHRPA